MAAGAAANNMRSTCMPTKEAEKTSLLSGGRMMSVGASQSFTTKLLYLKVTSKEREVSCSHGVGDLRGEVFNFSSSLILSQSRRKGKD